MQSEQLGHGRSCGRCSIDADAAGYMHLTQGSVRGCTENCFHLVLLVVVLVLVVVVVVVVVVVLVLVVVVVVVVVVVLVLVVVVVVVVG